MASCVPPTAPKLDIKVWPTDDYKWINQIQFEFDLGSGISIWVQHKEHNGGVKLYIVHGRVMVQLTQTTWIAMQQRLEQARCLFLPCMEIFSSFPIGQFLLSKACNGKLLFISQDDRYNFFMTMEQYEALVSCLLDVEAYRSEQFIRPSMV